MSDNGMEGKTAFITGGVSGIGLGMAKAFLRAGMQVVVTFRRSDHLAQAQTILRQEGLLSRFAAVEVDVTEREALIGAAADVESRYGPVHLLCNNAGVNLFTPIDEASWEDWEWVMRVNLFGVVNGLLAFLPRMKSRRSGHILNTASMSAFISGAHGGIYTASKFAVRGLTESLRHSLKPHGIGVSLLSPGLTRSNIHECAFGRPASLRPPSHQIDPAGVKRDAEILALGMDPDEVGEKALRGMLRNDLHIFTHPEFKEELAQLSEVILNASPQEAPDPRRLRFEQARRAARGR